MAYYSQYTAAISNPLVMIDQVLKEKDEEIAKLRQRIFQLELNASLCKPSTDVEDAHERQLVVLAENREFSTATIEEPGVTTISKPKKIFKRIAIAPKQVTTTVVNVKFKNIHPEYDNLEEWMKNPNHVYIGQPEHVCINQELFPKVESEWFGSAWMNPYKRDKNVLVLYEVWLREKLEREGMEEFMKLKGKKLGCYCKSNQCHGNIIIKLLEELA